MIYRRWPESAASGLPFTCANSSKPRFCPRSVRRTPNRSFYGRPPIMDNEDRQSSEEAVVPQSNARAAGPAHESHDVRARPILIGIAATIGVIALVQLASGLMI